MAIIGFFLGSTLFTAIGFKIFLAAGQTNLLAEAITSTHYLKIYRHAPEKLEESLVRDIACSLKSAKEVQTHMLGFGSKQNSNIIKEVEETVERIGGSCPDI